MDFFLLKTRSGRVFATENLFIGIQAGDSERNHEFASAGPALLGVAFIYFIVLSLSRLTLDNFKLNGWCFNFELCRRFQNCAYIFF